MDFIQTIIISIVEGLTEFLPVSSTGHMIIVENLLGVDIQDKFVNAFTVIIQFGAILSVICLYWKRFFYPEAVKTGEKTYWKAMFDFYARLLVGTVPAVVLVLPSMILSSQTLAMYNWWAGCLSSAVFSCSSAIRYSIKAANRPSLLTSVP